MGIMVRDASAALLTMRSKGEAKRSTVSASP